MPGAESCLSQDDHLVDSSFPCVVGNSQIALPGRWDNELHPDPLPPLNAAGFNQAPPPSQANADAPPGVC